MDNLRPSTRIEQIIFAVFLNDPSKPHTARSLFFSYMITTSGAGQPFLAALAWRIRRADFHAGDLSKQ